MQNDNEPIINPNSLAEAKKNAGFFSQVPTPLMLSMFKANLTRGDIASLRQTCRFFSAEPKLKILADNLPFQTVSVAEFLNLVENNACSPYMKVVPTKFEILTRIPAIANALKSGKCKPGLYLDFHSHDLQNFSKELELFTQAWQSPHCPIYLFVDFSECKFNTNHFTNHFDLFRIALCSGKCPEYLHLNLSLTCLSSEASNCLFKAFVPVFQHSFCPTGFNLNLSHNYNYSYNDSFFNLFSAILACNTKHLNINLSSLDIARIQPKYFPKQLIAPNLTLNLSNNNLDTLFIQSLCTFLSDVDNWHNFKINLENNTDLNEVYSDFCQYMENEKSIQKIKFGLQNKRVEGEQKQILQSSKNEAKSNVLEKKNKEDDGEIKRKKCVIF